MSNQDDGVVSGHGEVRASEKDAHLPFQGVIMEAVCIHTSWGISRQKSG